MADNTITWDGTPIDEIKRNNLELNKIDENGTIGEMIETINANFRNLAEHGGGPAGLDGANGQPGVDGTNIEYIFALCDTMNPGEQYPTDSNEIADLFNKVTRTGQGSYPEGNPNVTWYNQAMSISEENKNEYVLIRYKTGFGTWAYESKPVLWAHWGEAGTDGDGVEYIFISSNHEFVDSELSAVLPKKSKLDKYQKVIFQIDDFYPGEGWFTSKNKTIAKKALDAAGVSLTTTTFNSKWNNYFGFCDTYSWSDNPTGTGPTNLFEYVSIRRSNRNENGVSVWGDFSTPVLWSNYGMPTRTFLIYYGTTDKTENPEAPTGGWWDAANDDLITNKEGYELTDGWSNTDDYEPGTIIWLSTGIFDHNGELASTWTKPVRITGDKGEKGVDGASIEFIYAFGGNEMVAGTHYPQSNAWEAFFNTVEDPEHPASEFESDVHTDDEGLTYVAYGDIHWYDRANPISEQNRIEYVWIRTKAEDDTQWTYSQPIMWARWGEDGTDGDGVEYVYKITSTNETPDTPNSEDSDDYVPVEDGWTDNPTGVSVSNPYEWVSVRRSNKDEYGIIHWGEFSEPALWAKYSLTTRTFIVYCNIPKSDPGIRSNPTVIKPEGGFWNIGYTIGEYELALDASHLTTPFTCDALETMPANPDAHTCIWEDSNVDVENTITYMASGVFSENGDCLSWTEPQRITGAQGEKGVDGSDIQFVYARENSMLPGVNYPDVNDGEEMERTNIFMFLEVGNQYAYKNTTWYNHAQGVDINHTTEYCWIRQKKSGASEWSYTDAPFIWSKFGEDGTDGDGIDYIFKLTNTNTTPSTPSAVNVDNWTDNPTGVSPTNPYEWVSIRKFENNQWGSYSTPALWAKYSKQIRTFVVYVYVPVGTTPMTPQTNGYWDVTDDILRSTAGGREYQSNAVSGSTTYKWKTSYNNTPGMNAWRSEAVFDESGENQSGWSSPIKISDSRYKLDLTNETALINADSTGSMYSNAIKALDDQNCTAKLYCGTEEVSGVTFSYTPVTTGLSINASTGRLTFTSDGANQFTFPNETLAITVNAAISGTTVGTAIMTIGKAIAGAAGSNGSNGQNGADAVTQWINLTADAIHCDASGTNPNPSTIAATVWKQVGAADPTVDSSTSIYWGYDTTTPVIDPANIYSSAVTVSTINHNFLTFGLETNGSFYEIETVPILRDGQDGEPGTPGNDGDPGTPGNGYQYKYVRYSTDYSTTTCTITNANTDNPIFKFGTDTATATDVPQGVDSTYTYEFRSERYGYVGNWSNWSNPVIIGKYLNIGDISTEVNDAVETATQGIISSISAVNDRYAYISQFVSSDGNISGTFGGTFSNGVESGIISAVITSSDLSNTFTTQLNGLITGISGVTTFADWINHTTGDLNSATISLSAMSGYASLVQDVTSLSSNVATYAGQVQTATSDIAELKQNVARATYLIDASGYFIVEDSSVQGGRRRAKTTEGADASIYADISDADVSNLILDVTEMTTIAQTVSEHNASIALIAAVSDSSSSDGRDFAAAIFMQANKSGSSIGLNADNITINASHILSLSAGTFEISSGNFTVDRNGSVIARDFQLNTGNTRIDASGTLYAQNAVISGQITADEFMASYTETSVSVSKNGNTYTGDIEKITTINGQQMQIIADGQLSSNGDIIDVTGNAIYFKIVNEMSNTNTQISDSTLYGVPALCMRYKGVEYILSPASWFNPNPSADTTNILWKYVQSISPYTFTTPTSGDYANGNISGVGTYYLFDNSTNKNTYIEDGSDDLYRVWVYHWGNYSSVPIYITDNNLCLINNPTKETFNDNSVFTIGSRIDSKYKHYDAIQVTPITDTVCNIYEHYLTPSLPGTREFTETKTVTGTGFYVNNDTDNSYNLFDICANFIELACANNSIWTDGTYVFIDDNNTFFHQGMYLPFTNNNYASSDYESSGNNTDYYFESPGNGKPGRSAELTLTYRPVTYSTNNGSTFGAISQIWVTASIEIRGTYGWNQGATYPHLSYGVDKDNPFATYTLAPSYMRFNLDFNFILNLQTPINNFNPLLSSPDTSAILAKIKTFMENYDFYDYNNNDIDNPDYFDFRGVIFNSVTNTAPNNNSDPGTRIYISKWGKKTINSDLYPTDPGDGR